MASIQITELRPAGYELFQDSESFLNELGDQELSVFGGKKFGGGKRPILTNVTIFVISQFTVSIGISIQSVSVVSAAG